MTDTAVDSESGYDIVYNVTPANSGWSTAWPMRISRYYSLEYIRFIMEDRLLEEVNDSDVSTYCAFINKKATTGGTFNTQGRYGEVIPLTYEAYLLLP